MGETKFRCQRVLLSFSKGESFLFLLSFSKGGSFLCLLSFSKESRFFGFFKTGTNVLLLLNALQKGNETRLFPFGKEEQGQGTQKGGDHKPQGKQRGRTQKQDPGKQHQKAPQDPEDGNRNTPPEAKAQNVPAAVTGKASPQGQSKEIEHTHPSAVKQKTLLGPAP